MKNTKSWQPVLDVVFIFPNIMSNNTQAFYYLDKHFPNDYHLMDQSNALVRFILYQNNLSYTIQDNAIPFYNYQQNAGNDLFLVDYIDQTQHIPVNHSIDQVMAYHQQYEQSIEFQQKQVQKQYLNAILVHGQSVVQDANKLKLHRHILNQHSSFIKTYKDQQQQIKQQRLNALRQDNEEEYLLLVSKTKDNRISKLLKQTNTFIAELISKMKVQKNLIITNHLEEDEEIPDQDYYDTAHYVKEHVMQPINLIGGTLKDYQVKGLEWMVSLYNNRLNGILADEMGLGKTIQSIALISYLIAHKQQMGPYLIVVPLSTLSNWTNEFLKWAPSISILGYKGSPSARKQMQHIIKQRQFTVCLTTFEYIIKDKHVLKPVKWLYTIIDEGHRMKNSNSKLSLTLNTQYSSRFRLILTGTPLQNNLQELWSILNFILPKIFNSDRSFDEWFSAPFGVSNIELSEEESLLIIKRLHKVLRPFLLRRLKKDVESELPDKIERIIKTPFSALQLKLYEQMRLYNCLFTVELESTSKSFTGIKGLNNTIMQLRKICNHPFVFPEIENSINPQHLSNDVLYRSSGKFELLDRLLPKLFNTNHRVLMFFQMTSVMTIMEDFCLYKGFKYLRLDGSTKAEDRGELLRLFNAPNSPYQLFILSTRAGGLGLNLQSADTVIIFDSDWNPHQDLQAQDRAHRIGQKHEVRIFRLISSNSVEEKILERAQFKLDMDGKIIQAGKFDNKSTDKEREAFLKSLLDNTQKTSNEEEECLSDSELNEILARNEHELDVFRKMDHLRQQHDNEEWTKYNRQGEMTSRLMTLDELPEVYKNDFNPLSMKRSDQPDEFGRNSKKQKINYDDTMTEDEYVEQMIEGDGLQPKRKASANLPDKKMKMGQNRDGLLQVVMDLMDTLESEMDTSEDYERQRSYLFLNLPSKVDYPSYYKQIKKPISMHEIKQKAKNNQYQETEQVMRDLKLMFDNARTFNVEGSLVYEDANVLEQVAEMKMEELKEVLEVEVADLNEQKMVDEEILSETSSFQQSEDEEEQQPQLEEEEEYEYQ